jgi:hypothetical protein
VARVYSTLLASTTGVGDTPTLLGEPPDGSLWVVRFLAATFGDFVGYAGAGFSFTGDDPWLWLCQSTDAKLIGVHKQTFVWEGRWVIPEHLSLYAMSSSSDSCDIIASGYTLTVAS